MSDFHCIAKVEIFSVNFVPVNHCLDLAIQLRIRPYRFLPFVSRFSRHFLLLSLSSG